MIDDIYMFDYCDSCYFFGICHDMYGHSYSRCEHDQVYYVIFDGNEVCLHCIGDNDELPLYMDLFQQDPASTLLTEYRKNVL